MHDEQVNRRDALVQAAAAGAVVLGASTATAQQPKDAPKVNHEEPVPSTAKPEDYGPRELWAVIDRDGKLQRGMHVESARRLGLGMYEVIFRRDVRRGCYLATLGGHDFGGLPPSGHIGVQGRANNARGVLVTTTSNQGDPAAFGFHLLVICPDGHA